MKIRIKRDSNSLFSQLFNFGLGPIIGMAVSMLTVPITTRLLSPEEFGKSSLFTLVQTIFNLIVLFGIDQSYVRFYNQKDIDKKELLFTCLLIPFVLCLLIMLITIVFAKKISLFMFGSWEPYIMLAFVFFLPSLLLNRFALLTIRMDLRGKLYSFLTVFQHVLNFFILLSFLLFYEKTFRSIVFSTIIASIIVSIIAMLCSKQFLPIKLYKINKSLVIEVLKFGLPLVPAAILSWIMNSFDKVSLRMWSSFEELGLYAAAFKIVSLITIFQTIFTTAWTPMAYKWYEEKVENKKFEEIGFWVLSFMTVLFAGIIVFRDILMLILGPDYRNTGNIFVFLLFSPVLYTISETTCQGIGFAKKTIYSLYISIIAAVLNIIGNYFLVPKYGAQGAAISTCISFIAFFWSRTLFSRKVWFKFDIIKYFFNIFFLLLFGINMLTLNNKLFEILLFIILVSYNGYFAIQLIKEKKLNKEEVNNEYSI